MRVVFACVAVASGCGRFGFESGHGHGHELGDARSDTALSPSPDARVDAGGDLGDGPPGTPLTVIDPLTEGPDTVSLTMVGSLELPIPAANVVGGVRVIGVAVTSANSDTSVEVDTGVNRIVYRQGSLAATFVVRYGATSPLNVALPTTATLRIDVATADGAATPCPVGVTIIDTAGRAGTATNTITGASMFIDIPAADPAYATVDLERIAELRFEFAPETQGADLQLRPFVVLP